MGGSQSLGWPWRRLCRRTTHQPITACSRPARVMSAANPARQVDADGIRVTDTPAPPGQVRHLLVQAGHQRGRPATFHDAAEVRPLHGDAS